MKTHKVSLPYVNNVLSILLTLAINLGVVFLFYWPGGTTYAGALADSVFCTIITVAIDMLLVYGSLKKMRAAGMLPTQVPISRFMQRLPKNPVAFSVFCIAIFGVLAVGLNGLVLWFFGMASMGFVPWLVYKLLYSTILSVKITEFIVFRYVQPDWAATADITTEAQIAEGAQPIKNPLPKISVFKEMYASVTGNIAMNIIIGTALGGVVIGEGGAVVIYPTLMQSIHITGLVFGFIVGVLVTNGVVNGVNQGILAAVKANSAEPAPLPPADKRFTWMPKKKIPLMCLVCICMMLFSAIALWAIMQVFGIERMNFYQYTIFITIYAAVVSKPLVNLLIRRCTQPDYILNLLSNQGN